MPVSLIIGNGFSIDAAKHCGLNFNFNNPWVWDLVNPYNSNQALLDVFPKLKNHLESKGELKALSLYDSLKEIINVTQSRPIYEIGKRRTEEDIIHYEACHFLRLAYSWYSNQFSEEKLRTWSYFLWLQNNWQFVDTILSFNYDLILEKILKMQLIGKIYSGSLMDMPLFNKARIYADNFPSMKTAIHIAKPHGSANFTGWGTRSTSENNIEKPLYPIDFMLVRDSTLKILEEDKLYIPTSTADIVLPGEWSCWNKYQTTHLPWAKMQTDAFVSDTRDCEALLVIGFSYSAPDKEEFYNIIKQLPMFDKIQIIDPNPNIELIELLQSHGKNKIEIYNGMG